MAEMELVAMIDIYVENIEVSLEKKCYFSALSLALILPDICGTVEFPNKQVSERYIGWCDKYIDIFAKNEGEFEKCAYLNGEMVYNLRNTFLHTGSPNIDTDKLKEEGNQVDKFVLVVGDGTKITDMSLTMSDKSKMVKAIYVDITFLCNTLCEYALAYYKENEDRFKFDFDFILQSELFDEKQPLGE